MRPGVPGAAGIVALAHAKGVKRRGDVSFGERVSGVEEVVALDAHAGIQGIYAFLQSRAAVFIFFTIKGPQQKIAAMKEGVRFLVDIDQLSADGACAELGHDSFPFGRLKGGIGIVFPGHACQQSIHFKGFDVFRG